MTFLPVPSSPAKDPKGNVSMILWLKDTDAGPQLVIEDIQNEAMLFKLLEAML